ncbi:MAG TPA: adenylate kinase family protein [Thermoplasmata archaeon]|nr:adenylate kinase family protein [Thermoplasmata archaeon]
MAASGSHVTRRIALTGTPGTGKSTVARSLSRRHEMAEVGDIARRLGCARGDSNRVVVDVGRLVRLLRQKPSRFESDLVVGHLAHLLPIRDVVVLRCHPQELARRLRAAGKGNARNRKENVLAEAIGLIMSEALARGRIVLEVDTSGRTPAQVAREVERWASGPRHARWGRVDWLRDPAVTEHLMDWAD